MTIALPRAYGEPWEELLEARKPIEVALTTIPLLSNGHTYLSLNQGVWRLLESNQAARALLQLDASLQQTARRDASGDRVYDWSKLIAEVLDAYGQSPEYLVGFAELPPYRLRLGVKKSTVVARFARKKLAGNEPGMLRYISSTLDAWGVMHGFSVQHGELPEDYEGAVGVTYSSWFIERESLKLIRSVL